MTNMFNQVEKLTAQGKCVQEIMEITGLKRETVWEYRAGMQTEDDGWKAQWCREWEDVTAKLRKRYGWEDKNVE